jgi:hypothetical protein
VIGNAKRKDNAYSRQQESWKIPSKIVSLRLSITGLIVYSVGARISPAGSGSRFPLE